MFIRNIDISNFRKLRKVTLDLSEKSTILVGPNNSGKTSAMYSLMKFLSSKRNFSINDISLANYDKLIDLGLKWDKNEFSPNDDLTIFRNILPFLDIWIEVKENELKYVSMLIPTLNFEEGLIGVRLSLEPTDIETMYSDYVEHRKSSIELSSETKAQKPDINDNLVWPNNLHEFLSKNFMGYLKVRKYKLNPEYKTNPSLNHSLEQLNNENYEITGDQFDCLIKVDSISAQRGFSDSEDLNSNDRQNLSSQLRSYYDKHINPIGSIEPVDILAMDGISKSFDVFESKVQIGFNQAISELSKLGYPGFSDPLIKLVTKLDPSQLLDHDSVVQFSSLEGNIVPSLPEKYNGLGYQNLISIIFKLISFRDDWMQVGVSKRKDNLDSIEPIQPIHLVLLEEPEAHLHVQVQQVFIKKAYDVLRNHDSLHNKNEFTTQMIISTHSSALAKDSDFLDLRYFRRLIDNKSKIPYSEILNLSKIFKSGSDSIKFVAKYLKSTQFDMFFADALILVEGSSEMILIPHLIRNKFSNLSKAYLSIIEISGRYAHMLQPLIEFIHMTTLIITDIDSASSIGRHKAEYIQIGLDQITTNGVISKWIPKASEIDRLVTLKEEDKIDSNNNVKVVYQTIEHCSKENFSAYVRTFEEALIMKNFERIKSFTVNIDDKPELETCNPEGNSALIFVKDEIQQITRESNISEFLFDLVNGNKFNKVHFATDMFYYFDVNDIETPEYIEKGLLWLESKLSNGNKEANGE